MNNYLIARAHQPTHATDNNSTFIIFIISLSSLESSPCGLRINSLSSFFFIEVRQ